MAEAKNKLGKTAFENFQKSNSIRSVFKDDLPRPENYKKMCELQLEEIRSSEIYQRMNNLDRIRRVTEGPKQYLCSKCGLPKVRNEIFFLYYFIFKNKERSCL